MLPCVFTMVAASRSLKDVDELCFCGLISVVAEFMFEARRHTICEHVRHILYMLKPITSETMLFLNVIVSES